MNRVRLSDQEISDVIRRLAALDMGGWTRGDVEAAIATLGWSRTEDESGSGSLVITTGLATGLAIASADLHHHHHHHRGGGVAPGPDGLAPAGRQQLVVRARLAGVA
jgi:hypothetical protein